MNAVQAYQMIYRTREVPYCSHPKHEHVIKDIKEIDECIRRGCHYLQFYYPEEIEVLRLKR